MAQTWSYTPQVVLTEALTTSVRIAAISPQSDVTGWLVDTAVRGWQLQYATVDTATANSMTAFYEAQKGAWLAFQWLNPNDGQLWTARFASDFSPALFRANILRTGEITFTACQS